MSTELIHIAEILNTQYCISVEQGEIIHNRIVDAINKNKQVKISFSGIEDITSAFLNAAIGQLYSKFSEDTLQNMLLPPDSADTMVLELLQRVINRAKLFFQKD